VLGDFNNDGWLDIAFSSLTQEFGVVLNLGRRTFSQPTYYPTLEFNAVLLAVGDMNEDANLDVLGLDNAGIVGFYAGKGDGTFAPPVKVADQLNLEISLPTADVDGDGHLDIIGAAIGATGVSIRYGDGKGSFPRTTDVLAMGPRSGPARGGAADFDLDGHLDV